MSFKAFFFRQKYRVDQAMTLLVIVNFLLLVLATSDKLKALLGISGTLEFTALFSVVIFFGVWFVGYLLEKKVRYQAYAEENVYKHSFIYRELERQFDEVKQEIRKQNAGN